jgi:dolichol-phosphate mannosyltransferase
MWNHGFNGVSVILPTYNEGGNIQNLIISIETILNDINVIDYEIIIVDDDSPDGTWDLAAKTKCISPSKVKVIRRKFNKGLTNSIRDGILASTYEVIIWMDCDFSHPPEKIPQLLFMINQGYDAVVNSRYTIGGGEDRVGKGGALQLVLSKILNWSVRFFLKPSFSDYTSGFIAVRKQVFRTLNLNGDYGEYFVDLIYRMIYQEYHICELPYIAMPRHAGESKTGTNIIQYASRGSKYLWTVIKLRFSNLSGSYFPLIKD